MTSMRISFISLAVIAVMALMLACNSEAVPGKELKPITNESPPTPTQAPPTAADPLANAVRAAMWIYFRSPLGTLEVIVDVPFDVEPKGLKLSVDGANYSNRERIFADAGLSVVSVGHEFRLHSSVKRVSAHVDGLGDMRCVKQARQPKEIETVFGCEWLDVAVSTPTPEPILVEGTGNGALDCSLKAGKTEFTFTHTGSHRFTVVIIDTSGYPLTETLLLDHYGPFRGSGPVEARDDGFGDVRPGPCTIRITADGDWTVEMERR